MLPAPQGKVAARAAQKAAKAADLQAQGNAALAAAAAKIKAQEKKHAFKDLFDKISGTITKNPNIPGNSVEAAKPWQDLIDIIKKEPSFINNKNTSGKTLLAKAIDMKKARTVKLLLENGASIDWPLREDGTPAPTTHLYYAAASTNEILLTVLSTMTPEKKAEYLNKGLSPLHAAINSGDLSNINLILDTAKAVLSPEAAKAFVRKLGDGGVTSLMLAAAMSKTGDGLQIFDRLLAEGAREDVGLSDANGRNVLFRLIHEKPKMVQQQPKPAKKVSTYPFFTKVLDLLPPVDGVLPINKKDNRGYTPLAIHLVDRPSFDFVKYLVDKGADINVTTHDGLSLFHLITDKHGFKYADDYESIDYLKSKGLSINVQDGKMRTILLATIVASRWSLHWPPDSKIAEILQTGVDVNMGGEGNEKRPFIMPIVECISRGFYNSAQQLIQAGADFQGGDDVGLNDEKGAFPIHALSINGKTASAKAALTALLARDGVNVNIVNRETGCTAAHYAANREISKMLVDKGVNINALEKNGYTPIYYAAHFGRIDCLEYLKTVPAVDLTIKYRGINNKTLVEAAEANLFTIKNAAGASVPNVAVNSKIIELFGRAPPTKTWAGWSRANASAFDSIFADAEDEQGTSCCPICLKTVVRSDGCVYIQGHNCSAAGGDSFYHKKLYEKFKMPSGNIVWCTLCGRICYDHRHYKLFPAQQAIPKITRLSTEDVVNATLEKQGDYFTRDCRGDGSGGGKIEKLMRFRRGREYALELQKELERQKTAAAAGGPPVSLTETQALEELVEEMWNAPFARSKKIEQILVDKKWNIPHDAFPLPVEAPPEPEVDMATLPNITAPAGHKATVPEEEDDDVLTGETGKVIHFEHVQPLGGAIINHAAKREIIGRGSLISFIRDKIRDYKNDEYFGRCIFAPSCNGPLYPNEIAPFFEEAVKTDDIDMTKDAVMELFEDYRIKFNWKFKRGVKGGRRTRKYKGKRRTLKGGSNWKTSEKARSVFVPAKNVRQNNTRNAKPPRTYKNALVSKRR